MGKHNPPIQLNFKWVDDEGAIDLGVLDSLRAEKGNGRDGGCKVNFETSEPSIGMVQKFTFYLFAEDVAKLSRVVWTAFLETEPSRAKKCFKALVKELEKTEKGKSK